MLDVDTHFLYYGEYLEYLWWQMAVIKMSNKYIAQNKLQALSLERRTNGLFCFWVIFYHLSVMYMKWANAINKTHLKSHSLSYMFVCTWMCVEEHRLNNDFSLQTTAKILHRKLKLPGLR